MMDKNEKVIKRPTVGEFIQFLQQFPIDAPLRIMDPDTGWTISILHAWTGDTIVKRPDVVWVSGEYTEMDEENEA